MENNPQTEYDARKRLKELKDKIKNIDVFIKDSSTKIKLLKSNPEIARAQNYALQESSMLLSCKNQKYELLTDPRARPVLETSMRIINDREKATKAAYRTLDEIVKELEKIQFEENEFLQRYIDDLIKVIFF